MKSYFRVFLKTFVFCALVSFWGGLSLSLDAQPEGFADRPLCEGAIKGDNNIWWSGLEHNSFEAQYRRPFGAVTTAQGNVLLRFRTCANDVEEVRLTVWQSRQPQRGWHSMQAVSVREEARYGSVQYWEYSLPIPQNSDILYYFFEIRDGSDRLYYIYDDFRIFPGGRGQIVKNWNDSQSYQLTVYDHKMQVPEWTQGAIIYKIFPDRYRNGDPTNDPKDASGWVYGQKIRKMPWNKPLCDPYTAACPDEKYNLFYGGDLKGITQKLGSIKELGTSAIYLNPIFESPTNHRYDTTNFMKIDPILGNLDDFKELVAKAKEKDIRIVLDGVFNHVSADSPYFDLFGRWNSSFELTSPGGIGRNDGSGACESYLSPWRSWFYIPDVGNPALFRDRRTKLFCPNPMVAGSYGPTDTYEAWFNFFNVPKINTGLKEVRDFFYQGGPEAVGPYWTGLGASGWRLDVGGDIDPGMIRDPNNRYWNDFRDAIKAVDSDAWIIGEEWGNATPWLLGNEWDSVMNYRLRAALLNWMFDSCRGAGCYGRYFSENDSNPTSPTGPIFPVTETQFLDQILGVQESYPEPVWHSAMNLLGSHDTNRILFLLKKISNEDSQLARRKLEFLSAFQMTYPGAPSIYYGDEVGVDAAGSWQHNTWIDDPYNRVPYPWEDQGLSPDKALLAKVKRLGQLRAQSPALQKGDFQSLVADNRTRVLSFARSFNGETYLIVLNRENSSQDIVIPDVSKKLSVRKFEEVYPAQNRVYSLESGALTLKSIEGLGVRILRNLRD